MPIPSVRVPIGLGGIALEGEAVDPAGYQRAAMLWARGANSFFGKTRVSPVGDAYELASSFGSDSASCSLPATIHSVPKCRPFRPCSA